MLLGEKIRLRAVLKADLAHLQKIYTHPEVLRFLDSRGDVSLGVFEAKLSARHDSKERKGEWLVLEDVDGNVVGSIAYISKWRSSEVSLEDLYVGVENQNKGYAAGAVMRLVKYLLEEKEFKRIEVLVREDNPSALKVFEKAGFVREGIRRSSAFSKGKYINEIFLSKLARETLI